MTKNILFVQWVVIQRKPLWSYLLFLAFLQHSAAAVSVGQNIRGKSSCLPHPQLLHCFFFSFFFLVSINVCWLLIIFFFFFYRKQQKSATVATFLRVVTCSCCKEGDFPENRSVLSLTCFNPTHKNTFWVIKVLYKCDVLFVSVFIDCLQSERVLIRNQSGSGFQMVPSDAESHSNTNIRWDCSQKLLSEEVSDGRHII